MGKGEVTISRVWETCIWTSSHGGFEHVLCDTFGFILPRFWTHTYLVIHHSPNKSKCFIIF